MVMPAYNASKTLEQTYREIPADLVDEVILVDDASTDDTAALAESLGIVHVIRHDFNKGYGANQKTCYTRALELGADIIIMLHPDYQYNPKLIPVMAALIAGDVYPVVMGSRILGGDAVRNGMPVYKYVFNRCLTFFQNLLLGQKLSEYHSGYRAYSANALRSIHFMANSDDFVFDNQMVSQIFYKGFEIGEVTCPTKYFEEASSINFKRSVEYGLGCLKVCFIHLFCKLGVMKSELYK